MKTFDARLLRESAHTEWARAKIIGEDTDEWLAFCAAIVKAADDYLEATDAPRPKRMRPLTPAQERMLSDVREAGRKRYNGRARPTIEVLEREGLIAYDYELIPHVKGGGTEFTERFTVRLSIPE